MQGLLDYEVDSDDEWVEEQAAENVEEVDNDEESEVTLRETMTAEFVD